MQPAPLLLDDVELLVSQRLRTLLAARPEPYAANVHVSNKVPNPRKARMVIVRSDGGNRIGDNRSLVRLGINAWGAVETDAADLARLVAALLPLLATGEPVTAVPAVSVPYALPEESEQHRRYLTAELHLRGTLL